MKKISFLLTVICLAFTSCTKSNISAEPEMVQISFSHKVLIDENSMTKSESTNPYVEMIKKHTPSVVEVTLKNIELDKEYYVMSNDTIKLPVGVYEISAVSPSESSPIVNGAYYEKPSIVCDKFTMNITEKTTDVKLNMYYDCYAVFAHKSECNKFQVKYKEHHNHLNDLYIIVSNQDDEEYYVAYFKENSVIRIIPFEYGTEYNRVVVNFVVQSTKAYETTKAVQAKYGKYYVVRSVAVDKTQSVFDTIVKDMEQGVI